MIIAPFVEGRQHDEMLDKTIGIINRHISEKDDDFLTLFIGETGTGKSTLALHWLTKAIPAEKISVNKMVAFSMDDFATCLKEVSIMDKPRAILYDEANIQKRDSLTKANKRLIDLYFAIRGLNILHIWCNPSLDVIDKVFIKERIKAIVYIKGKDITHPRYYFYFRANDILKILEKYGHLDLRMLNKVKGKYAYYRGWFRDYDGVLAADYSAKKKARMVDKVQEFFNDFGNNTALMTSKMLSMASGYSTGTIRVYANKGILRENDHYLIDRSGRYRFKNAAVEFLLTNTRGKINVFAKNGYKPGTYKRTPGDTEGYRLKRYPGEKSRDELREELVAAKFGGLE